MWILILTITTYAYSGANGAVSSVAGFTTEAACMAGASAYLAQKVARPDSTLKTALCVKA